ncbi:hypothetical protein PPL_11132 [Heterostelium album PN500]|uniref:Ankyrin repeat protein n=1 Tax=Heterostelium pallidum (strain ATCC 26659 / Pp 5 / PN500) TaxID=670386 RepID=D3BT11_HETP5|nr:hypothetical protein PPL_11132 [Heterostelium album PN500]EFA75626.1 hypothetical protein PPL_11132 [Heterostelium album PN500]|eukprot:XP_020427760.1 hypothetical protein PPL_11132 [Heterostelium album PN500]
MDKLFSEVLLNRVVNQKIFENVSILSTNKGGKSFEWNEVIKNPYVMCAHNLLDHLKSYLESDSVKYNGVTRDEYSTEFNINSKGRLDESLVLEHAIIGGSLEMVEYLMNHFRLVGSKVGQDRIGKLREATLDSMLIQCSENGRIDVAQYLLATFPEHYWDYYSAMVIAPKSGDMETLKFFIDLVDTHGIDRSQQSNVFNTAAQYGTVELIKLLKDNREKDFSKSNMFLYAIYNGNIKVLHYLLEEHIGLLNRNDTNLLESAANYNQFEIFKLLFQHNCVYSDQVIEYIAAKGNLEMLVWVQQQTNCELTSQVMEWATFNGHTEMVKWLFKNTTLTCNEEMVDGAIGQGHLETVQLLYENCTSRASSMALTNAVSDNHINVVRWMIENNHSFGQQDDAMSTAVVRGHLECLKYLHENTTFGCTPNDMDQAAYNGDLNVIKFLTENRSEGCSTQAMDNAITEGHMDVLEYLHLNRTEGCTSGVLPLAIKNGEIKIALWLMKNRTECKQTLEFGDIEGFIDNILVNDYHETLEWILNNISIPTEQIINYKNALIERYPNSIRSLQLLNKH